MTLKETNSLIETACNAIFQIETAINKTSDDDLRREGYRLRIALSRWSSNINYFKDIDDISKNKE